MVTVLQADERADESGSLLGSRNIVGPGYTQPSDRGMGRSSKCLGLRSQSTDPGAGAQTHCHNCRASPQPSDHSRSAAALRISCLRERRQIFNLSILSFPGAGSADLHIDV